VRILVICPIPLEQGQVEKLAQLVLP